MRAIVGEHHETIHGLKKFQKTLTSIAAVFVGLFITIIVLITIFFFLFPESTAKTFGYVRSDPNSKQFTFNATDSLFATTI